MGENYHIKGSLCKTGYFRRTWRPLDPIPGARSRMQTKESSRGSQAPRSGYRVERADLRGGRWSGGAQGGRSPSSAGDAWGGELVGLQRCGSGNLRKIGRGMGPKKGRMKERACRGRRSRDIGRESIALVREIPCLSLERMEGCKPFHDATC